MSCRGRSGRSSVPRKQQRYTLTGAEERKQQKCLILPNNTELYIETRGEKLLFWSRFGLRMDSKGSFTAMRTRTSCRKFPTVNRTDM